MTINNKIKELHKNTIKDFEEQIIDIEMLLKYRDEQIIDTEISKENEKKYSFINFASLKYLHKSKEELKNIYIKTLKDFEYYKNNTINNTYGWNYMEDVNYLTIKQNKEFENLMLKEFDKYYLKEYPKDKIFIHLNYLGYLSREIKKIEVSQRKYNIDRARKKQPTRQILEILKYVGDDNQVTEPLVELLYNMNGNFAKHLSLKQRDIYHKFTLEKKVTRKLNIDRKKEFKIKYKEESSNLLKTIKDYRSKYAKEVQTEIINILK